jgi:hypothetical protein
MLDFIDTDAVLNSITTYLNSTAGLSASELRDVLIKASLAIRQLQERCDNLRAHNTSVLVQLADLYEMFYEMGYREAPP